MASSIKKPKPRRATSQILNRLLQHFRSEMMADPDPTRFPGLRFTHMHVIGNVGRKGVRLTELADRAQLGLAACSELVNELESIGYIERRADPDDRRAKLIFPTVRGGELLDAAADAVTAVDAHWRRIVGANRFNDVMAALDEILTTLDAERRSDNGRTR